MCVMGGVRGGEYYFSKSVVQWKDIPWVYATGYPRSGMKGSILFWKKLIFYFLRWAGVLGGFMSPKSRKRRLLTNHYVELFWLFCKTYFFRGIPFRSVPSFGISSSAEVGMPRNEHFLPRNNGNRSEPIPRNFFGTKFRSQPYLEGVYWPKLLSLCTGFLLQLLFGTIRNLDPVSYTSFHHLYLHKESRWVHPISHCTFTCSVKPEVELV